MLPEAEKIRNYSKLFYEPPTLSLEQSFATYPGQLNIQQILQGKNAAFSIPGTEPKKEKKIVVISDWSLKLVDNQQRKNQACCLVRALILEGFDVRYWNGKKTVTIPGAEKEIENQFQCIKADTANTINKSIALESDAILHLDYFELAKLIKYLNHDAYSALPMLKTNILDINDVLEFKQIPVEIYQWIKNKQFRLEYIPLEDDNSIQPETTIETIKLWLTVLSDSILEIKLKITAPSLMQEIGKLKNLQSLEWEEVSEQKRAIIIESSSIEDDSWKNVDFLSTKLKTLRLSHSSITANVFESFLKSNTEVEKISLDFCHNIKEGQQLCFPTLRKLECLELRVTNSHVLVEELIQSSPNLQTLTLMGYTGMESFSSAKIYNASLSKLKKLCVSSFGFSAKVIAKILSQATELEELSLAYIPDVINLHSNLISCENKFLKLKDLDLRDIPLVTYLELVSLFPLVDKLNLRSINNIDSPLGEDKTFKEVENYDLSTITTFNASYSKIDGKLLAIFINRMPNIRKLEIYSCKNINNFQPEDIDDNIIFSNLECIEAEFSNIPGNTVGKIIAKSPNLLSVNVDNCKNFHSFRLPDSSNFFFKNLEKFSAKNSFFSLRQYLLLLSGSERLTTLGLEYVNLQEDINDTVFDGIRLDHIKHLIVSDHQQIGKIFSKLLCQIFNIETITYHVKNFFEKPVASIDEKHIPDGLRLNSLKVLKLQNLSITGKAIAKLIKSSMEISEIDLSDCKWCGDLSPDLVDEAGISTLTSFKCQNSSLSIATIITFVMNMKTNLYCGAINSSCIDIDYKNIIIKESYFKKATWEHGHFFSKSQLFYGVETVIIDTYSKDFPGSFLNSLLCATPNIRHLELNCRVTDCSGLPKVLNNLITLKLSALVEPHVQEYLIAASPHLKVLSANNSSHVDRNVSQAPLVLLEECTTFEDLEIIELNDSHISANFFLKVIERSPQLKKITLAYIQPPDSVIDFYSTRRAEYYNLEAIHFSNSKIPSDILVSLLSSSCKIKSLVFLNTSFLGIKKIEWEKAWPELEEIRISHSDYIDETGNRWRREPIITGKQFIALLKNSPKLKKVYFLDVAINDLTLNDIPDNLYLKNLDMEIVTNDLDEQVVNKLKQLPLLVSIRNFKKTNLSKDISCNFTGDGIGQDFLKKPESAFPATDAASNGKKVSPIPKPLSSEISYPSGSNVDIPVSVRNRLEKGSHPPSSKPKASLEESISSQILQESKGLPSKAQLKTKELFTPGDIHPAKYRLRVIHGIDIRENQIYLIESSDKKYVAPQKKITFSKKTLDSEYNRSKNSGTLAFCKTEITITPQWQSLPAFFGSGAILNFYTDCKQLYDVIYSKTDNLFYIRSRAEKKTSSNQTTSIIQFIVEYRLPETEKNNWPADIQKIINNYKEFKHGKLDTQEGSGIENLLNAYDCQKMGSCLIRSILCQQQLKKLFKFSYSGYTCHLIVNDIHAFVEIIDQDHNAYVVDLGGYEADLTIEKQQEKKVEKEVKENKKESTNAAFQKIESELEQNIQSAKPIIVKKIITKEDIYPGFRTWEKKESSNNKTVEALFNKFSIPGTNSLIKVENPDDCLNIIAAFGASECRKPYFLVDLPEQLQWQARGLTFASENDCRLAIRKHYSPLRHFLKTHPDGVLFINFSHFSAVDLTKLHSIIDTDRQLESKPLPKALSIVGFYSDNTENPYYGADFLTRFTQAPYSWSHSLDVDLYHNRSQENDSPSNEKILVNLYESEDWETLLFGFILIQNKQFSFANHGLITSLEPNPLPSLHLKNPPWHLREFQLFWQMALQQGYFFLYGKSFRLADNFKLTYHYRYEYDTEVIQQSNENPSYTHPFNSHTFHEYFSHYDYSNGSFVRKPGLLEQHPHLSLVVTQDMPQEKWIQLLAEANRVEKDKQKTTIDITLTQNISLPSVLEKVPSRRLLTQPTLLDNTKQLSDLPYAIIQTTTPLLIEQLLCLYPEAMFIKLDTTHNFGDLIYQIHPQITDEEIIASFIESDPWKALQRGETVIVEGHLSQQLINALSTLFIAHKKEMIIQGEPKPFKGQLLFVTNQQISWATHQFRCDTLEQVKQLGSLQDNQAKEENHLIPNNIPVEDPQDLSLEACKQFENRRFEAIEQGFSKSPIIFYTGPTGIGKSTYFVKEFANEYSNKMQKEVQIYLGEDNLENFAQHKDETKEPILFIDEANLSTLKLSILRGVKSQRPHILINGHYCPFNGKIILAGNDKNYGGVRQQHDFFDECAQIVECERPNHAYLYHRILKKQLEKNNRSQEKNFCEGTAKIILTIFDKINQLAGLPNPLLSPRHLHMITVLFNAFCEQFKNINITSNFIIVAACLQVIGDSLPAGKRNRLLIYLNKFYGYDENCFLSFQSAFIQAKLDKLKTNNFCFTKTRYPCLQTLDAFLSIRKQSDFQWGILLEGESGIGKSEMLKYYLEASDIDYIPFSVSNNSETDKQLLRDAFYEGKVVIFNELNADGQKYEQLINSLIMGDDPSGNKEQRPRKPGFMVIATQNPITHPGRWRLSIALQARFTLLQVSEYPESELVSILENAGIPTSEAKDWVDEFRLSISYANFHGLEPKPNVRTLLIAAGLVEGSDKDTIKENLAQVRQLVSHARESKAFSNIANINSGDKKSLCKLFLDPSNPKDQLLLDVNATTEEDTPNSSRSPQNSDELIFDEQLLKILDEKLKSLQSEDTNNSNSWKAKRRQAKINYLQELRVNYQSNSWAGQNPLTIAQHETYRPYVFKSFFKSEVQWFANRIEKARRQYSENPTTTPVNMGCHIDNQVLSDLKEYCKQVHQQFIYSPHARLATRRLDKYMALTKISELYEKQQLTKEHIKQFEKHFSQLYDSFLSSKTRELINRVLSTIVQPQIADKSETSKPKL